MNLQEKPHIDPEIRLATDEFGFCHHRMTKPNTPIPSREDLFNDLVRSAYHAVTNIRQHTGRTPHCVRLSVRLAMHNRITTMFITLNVEEGETPGTLNIAIADQFAWAKLPYVMKQFLN